MEPSGNDWRFSFDPKRRRLVTPALLALLALGLIGVAVSFECFPWLLRGTKPAHGAAGGLSGEGAFSGLLAPPRFDARPPALASALYTPAEGETISLDEFIGLVSKAATPAVAEKAAGEFNREERLRKAYDKFVAEKGRRAPAAEFVGGIARTPEFRKLVSQFKGDPGFQRLFYDLGKDQRVAAVLRAALGAGTRTAAAGDRRSSTAIGPSRGLAGSGAAARGPGAGFGAAAGQQGFADPGGFGANAGPALAESPAARFSSQAGEATKLSRDLDQRLEQAGRKESDSMRSLYQNLPKEARDKVDAQCQKLYEKKPGKECYIPWACAAAGVWDECVAACEKSPSCSIPVKPDTEEETDLLASSEKRKTTESGEVPKNLKTAEPLSTQPNGQPPKKLKPREEPLLTPPLDFDGPKVILGSALAGLAVGAVIGSVVPGIGTVVGAGIGFTAGLVAGTIMATPWGVSTAQTIRGWFD